MIVVLDMIKKNQAVFRNMKILFEWFGGCKGEYWEFKLLVTLTEVNNLKTSNNKGHNKYQIQFNTQ